MIKKENFRKHFGEIQEDYRIFYYRDSDILSLKPHSHDYFEMYILIQGNVIYQTGACKFYLRPGDVMFINTGQVHHPHLVDNKIPYERIVLHVSPETLQILSDRETDLSECFTKNTFTVYHYSQTVEGRIMNSLYELFDLKESQQYAKRLVVRATLTRLFAEINSSNRSEKTFSFSADSRKMQTVEIIKQYILDRLDQKISVAEIAEYLYISKFHLMRIFKDACGSTLYQFILETRLHKADKLILEGLSFVDAGIACGFSDYSSFYRAFVNSHGVSPTEYYKGK